MTPELAPPSLLTTTPHQREDVSALDRFSVHRCPTRRVFSGTGLELVTRQATVRYPYHSATTATKTTAEHAYLTLQSSTPHPQEDFEPCQIYPALVQLHDKSFMIPSFLPQWLDSPRWVLVFSRSLFLASLLPASVLQFLVLKTRRSFSRPLIHLRFSLPFLRVPIGWALKTFLMATAATKEKVEHCGLQWNVVAAVVEWYRYRIVACLVTNLSPVPLKTHRVGQQWTLNLQRAETSSAASPLVRLGEEEEWWEAPDHPQSVLPQNWGETELNRSITCMGFNATSNNRRHLTLCHDEFRGP
ncbi:uncharacterized protein TNCV_3284951 [Trichonephila clavipes]|nr:uncharacterized protein TNCV_3284951 [Trichonephila clavipes]